MKRLKYVLFTFVVCFISLINVKAAACIYDPPKKTANGVLLNDKIVCKVNNNQVACSGENQLSVKKWSLRIDDFRINNLFICPSNVYVPTPTKPNQVDDIIINKESGYETFTKSSSSIDDTNSTITNPKTTACTYKSNASYMNQLTLTCTIRSNSSYNIICEASDGISIVGNSLKATDFPNFSCNENIYIKFNSTDNQILDISTSKGSVYDTLTLTNSVINEGSGNQEGNQGEGNTGENNLDLENFCTGPVQGVFTTLGWVFFVIKIAIPVLLIVFGTIDFTKAVVSSKDDEIKKSMKTLVVRVIAGIVVFFVPTLLNFIVSLIDDSDVYKGTFWDCTKCMLDPLGECEPLNDSSKPNTTLPFVDTKIPIVPNKPVIKPQINKPQTNKPQFGSDITFNYEYVDDKTHLTYALFTPSSVQKNKKTPLIIYLHGNAEKKNSSQENFKNKFFAGTINEWENYGLDGFNAYVLCPHSYGVSWASNKTKYYDLLDYIIEKYNIDTNKIILMGASAGGIGVQALANGNTDRYSALVVMSGYSAGLTSAQLQDLGKLPIRGYYAKADDQNSINYMNTAFANAVGKDKIFVIEKNQDGNTAVHDDVPKMSLITDSDNNKKSDLIEWALSQ